MGTHRFGITLWLLPILFLAVSCNVMNPYRGEPGEWIESGIASWYGLDYHGTTTANGETYNMESFTAAHPSLPFNTIVHVVNLDNGKTVNVRINNRGPYVEGRVIDLSRRAAKEVDIIERGLARVDIYMVREIRE